MTTAIKNAEISRRILAVMASNGGDVRIAIDEVLGEGTYSKIASDIWEAAQNDAK